MHYTPNILVTGGGGFLGSAIVRSLVAAGRLVRSFSRNHYPELERLGVEQVQGDLADAEAVRCACGNVEAVFHVAAKPPPWGPFADYYRANVIGTRNVIEACKACSVSRLIHTSSPSVVFDGGNMQNVDESAPYPSKFHAHYPRTKALAEKEVIQAGQQGLATIALRPHIIWGPGDHHFIPRLLARAHRLRRVGDGTNRVDTIYVDNAVLAHILAEQRLKEDPSLSGRVYFISQDDPIPAWEMIDRMLAAAGRPPVRKTISPTLAYLAGALCEGVYSLFRLKSEPPMTRFVARELATSHWFNISAAKRDLGYRPEISIDEGLQRLSTWLKNKNSKL